MFGVLGLAAYLGMHGKQAAIMNVFRKLVFLNG